MLWSSVVKTVSKVYGFSYASFISLRNGTILPTDFIIIIIYCMQLSNPVMKVIN